MLTAGQLQRAAAQAGYPADSLERVWRLLGVLEAIAAHPLLGPRVALKGGTALNVFLLDLPRLSVDIDLNWIDAVDREGMLAARPRIEQAIEQVAGRLGLTVKRAPSEHAGGKWRLGYTSALGRPAILEVDLNFMLRVPLWDPTPRSSPTVIDRSVTFPVLDVHELAAGKLAALVARRASRDLFDARELARRDDFDLDRLRLAFTVYGGVNRVDWRTVGLDAVGTTVEDVQRSLVPMLRASAGPPKDEIEAWVEDLVAGARSLLARLLPLTDAEAAFVEALNGRGEILPELLTPDAALQDRIRAHPGLLWKALNVRKHQGLTPE
jgi:predicted nucleotidyltransferase component of viral defense system